MRGAERAGGSGIIYTGEPLAFKQKTYYAPKISFVSEDECGPGDADKFIEGHTYK